MAKLYRFLRFQERQTQQKCCWQLPEIPFMQMSQAFRPMSCRFEKLRRFLLSQPRLLHSLRALQKFSSPTCISITLYNPAFKSLISCVKLLCSIAFAYGGKHVLGFSFGFYSMKLGRHSICHSGN